MASGPNISANLDEADRLIELAVAEGAALVVLPENFAIMGKDETDKVLNKETIGAGIIQDFLAARAIQHQLWIIGGTIPIAATDTQRVRSACLVYNPQGEMVARYDKMHLFDVQLPDKQEAYNESETIEAGDKIVSVETPLGRIGLAVCYDIRFPEMFRLMMDEDVHIFAIPSAFTATTGKDHWEVLVRTRAIENLCYVVAADQGGYHINGRETHGDSMIVDPWGNILDRRLRGNGVVVADIDIAHLQKARQRFPVLEHRKLICEH